MVSLPVSLPHLNGYASKYNTLSNRTQLSNLSGMHAEYKECQNFVIRPIRFPLDLLGDKYLDIHYDGGERLTFVSDIGK